MNDKDNGDCPCQSGASLSRRGVLGWTTYVLGGLAAAATGVPIVGFLLGPLRKEPDQWIVAGTITQFPEGETRLIDLKNPLGRSSDGDTGKIAVYVRRIAGEKFQIFSVNCTHLGCPVNWIPTAGLFLCPCHGGVFYVDGSRASGPPPRSLYEYDHRVEKGSLMVKLGHLPTLQQPA